MTLLNERKPINTRSRLKNTLFFFFRWLTSAPRGHQIYEDLEEWEAHGSWEVMPERNRSSSLLRATPPFRASTVGLT